MLCLKRSDYEAMVAWAQGLAPLEACGLIAGTGDDGGEQVVRRVFFCENTDASSEHFTIDPAEQLRCLKEARANGWRMLGNWHSHPETPARPSREDIRLARDSSANYLILSLAEPGHPALNAFRVEHDGFVSRTRLKLVEG